MKALLPRTGVKYLISSSLVSSIFALVQEGKGLYLFRYNPLSRSAGSDRMDPHMIHLSGFSYGGPARQQ